MKNQLPPEFAAIRRAHPEVFVIVSPPRSNSTAFARVFWEQPSVRFYAHEPFEVTYYRDQDLSGVAEKLERPLDLAKVKANPCRARAADLVIKEMPYQAGENFPVLAALATRPIVFLVRDPRLNIASRIEKKLEVGDSANFPLVETGWELLRRQIEYCRGEGLPHVIVESSEFRNNPGRIFTRLFELFGRKFSPATLRWRSRADLEIDNLGGEHDHLYRHVLGSTGVEPAREPIPDLDAFPLESGLRDHVAFCLSIYEELAAAPERLRASESEAPGAANLAHRAGSR